MSIVKCWVKGSVCLQHSGFCISFFLVAQWFYFILALWDWERLSNTMGDFVACLQSWWGSLVRERTSSVHSSSAAFLCIDSAFSLGRMGNWFPQTCSEQTYLFMRVSIPLEMGLVSFFHGFYKVLCSSKHQHWMLEWTHILKPDNYYFFVHV